MAGLRRILSIVLPTALPSAVYNSIMCWAEGALTPSLVLFLSACARFYENLRTIRAAFWPPWPLAYSIKSVIEDFRLYRSVRTRCPDRLNSNY